jgi:hypothetical protein
MITINVQETLRKAHEEKARQKGLPVIRIGKPLSPSAGAEPVIQKSVSNPQSDLVKSLWREYNAILLERNKLSTQIAHMVERGADQAELKDHYDKIESYRPQLQDLYHKIQYAEKHGELPSAQFVKEDPETLDSIKLKIRSLVDKRSKLKDKIAKKKASNPAKYVEWDLELAQVNVQYNELISKKKFLESKS